MKAKIYLIVLLVIHLFDCSAQSTKSIALSFNATFGNNKLVLNDSVYKLSNGDTIKIETFKFYISNIELLNNGKLVWKEENSFHLVDVADHKSSLMNLNLNTSINFNQIKFNLGIDSTTNVSGALGGCLDPTKGMYWTWQSGYINFKLEGTSKFSNARNNEFQFHLGGYQYPYYNIQTVELAVDSKEQIEINFDVQQFIAAIDFTKQNHIMSPSIDAVKLAQNASKIFSIK